MNTKKTSQDIGSLAAGILRDENASQIQKSLAASALVLCRFMNHMNWQRNASGWAGK